MSEVPIAVRPMQRADLDWVVSAEASLHPHPWSRGNFEDSFDAGHGCWVLAADETLLGYAVILVVLDEAHLLNLSVDLSCQRRGYGAAFLGFLLREARKQGAEQVFLEARESNDAALRLYRRCGFEAIGRRKGYYPAEGAREDAIVMRCAL